MNQMTPTMNLEISGILIIMVKMGELPESISIHRGPGMSSLVMVL